MSEASTDLLMKFVDSNGKTLEAEPLTQLAFKPSKLTEGFATGKMFEISSFSLETGLGGDDYDEQQETLQQNLEKITDALEDAKLGDLKLKPRKYRRLYEGELKQPLGYPVDMKPVGFSRLLDKTSAALMSSCVKREVFTSASVIMRKAGGTTLSGEAYLRLDFTDVLLTSIDWTEGDPIGEEIKFVCRGVYIRYLPQLPNGKFGGVRSAKWKSADDVRLQTV